MHGVLVMSLAAAAALAGCAVSAGAAGTPAVSEGAASTAAARPAVTPPPPATSLPDKIACGSATSCLAVGTRYESNDITIAQAPARAWVSGKWRSPSLPRPKGTSAAEALDVSCNAGVCLAVGDAGFSSGGGLPPSRGLRRGAAAHSSSPAPLPGPPATTTARCSPSRA